MPKPSTMKSLDRHAADLERQIAETKAKTERLEAQVEQMQSEHAERVIASTFAGEGLSPNLAKLYIREALPDDGVVTAESLVRFVRDFDLAPEGHPWLEAWSPLAPGGD